MGKNTGLGTRVGQIKDRKQVFNPKTELYIKVNTETGKFISSKDTPYKGVRIKEKDKVKIKEYEKNKKN